MRGVRLIVRAKNDISYPERSKSLVEEIKQMRLMKITNFINSLQKTDSFFVINNITNYEVNIYRTLLTDSFNQMKIMKKAQLN